MNSKELALIAAEAAEAKKAVDVVVLDLQGITIIADYFLICAGNSSTQVEAIANAIDDSLNEKKVFVLRREGLRDGKWVLLDYGSVVVHIFQAQEREFYSLERLWGDAKVIYPEKQISSMSEVKE